MNLEIGTQIQYTCALGTLNATIAQILIAPTAKKGFLNTWLVLDIPVQDGIERAHKTRITGDDSSLKMFKVAVVY
jgi:hypothetical protein